MQLSTRGEGIELQPKREQPTIYLVCVTKTKYLIVTLHLIGYINQILFRKP